MSGKKLLAVPEDVKLGIVISVGGVSLDLSNFKHSNSVSAVFFNSRNRFEEKQMSKANETGKT